MIFRFIFFRGLTLTFLFISFSITGFGDLTITQRRALDFTPAAGGDPAETLGPNSGGQYTITGPPRSRIFISLPTQPVTLSNGTSNLTLSHFASIPNGSFRLDSAGNGSISVGGTRNALPPTQSMGLYTGKFTLLVRTQSEQISLQADANERVLTSISVTKISDLVFGNRAAGDPSKTIAAGGPGAASFLVQGEPNKQYLIVLPTRIELRRGSGGASLRVSALTLNTPQIPTLPATGQQTFSVGGTVDAISSGTPPGVYTGSLLVSVTYQ